MLTLDALKEFGADTETGLSRCLNKEELYLSLVKKLSETDDINKLEGAIAENNLEAAFNAAHTLKGVSSNLSLDPISKPTAEMTEHLRKQDDADYDSYLDEIRKQWDKFLTICQ